MLIELAFMACLLAEPSHCKEHGLQFESDSASGAPMQCMMASQPKLAEWVDGHPKWFIKSWKCVYPSQKEVGI